MTANSGIKLARLLRHSNDDDFLYGLHMSYNRRKMKAMGIEFTKKFDRLSSIAQRDFSSVRYTTIKEAQDELSKGDVYITTLQLDRYSKTMYSYLKYSKLSSGGMNYNIDIYSDKLAFTKTSIVIGQMGSGKSVFLKNILAQSKFSRAVINDVKGEYVAEFYDNQKDIIFSLYDERGKVWNFFAYIRKSSALADIIASALASQITKEDDFWKTAAGNLLKKALLKSAYISDDFKENITHMLEYIENFKKQALETGNKTDLSIYSTISVLIETFELLRYLGSFVETFSIYDFVDSESKLFLLNSIQN